jgi:hypothetical protein
MCSKLKLTCNAALLACPCLPDAGPSIMHAALTVSTLAMLPTACIGSQAHQHQDQHAAQLLLQRCTCTQPLAKQGHSHRLHLGKPQPTNHAAAAPLLLCGLWATSASTGPQSRCSAKLQPRTTSAQAFLLAYTTYIGSVGPNRPALGLMSLALGSVKPPGTE